MWLIGRLWRLIEEIPSWWVIVYFVGSDDRPILDHVNGQCGVGVVRDDEIQPTSLNGILRTSPTLSTEAPLLKSQSNTGRDLDVDANAIILLANSRSKKWADSGRRGEWDIGSHLFQISQDHTTGLFPLDPVRHNTVSLNENKYLLWDIVHHPTKI